MMKEMFYITPLEDLVPTGNGYSIKKKKKKKLLPLLDYADFTIDCGRKVKIDKLVKSQERALKFVNNGLYGYENVSELYSVFNVQTLALRYREHICCFMFRQSKIDWSVL